MSNAPSNKKTKFFPRDLGLGQFRHAIHVASRGSREAVNIAFVGLEKSGKTSCMRAFIRALYPDYDEWKFEPKQHILHVRLTQEITFFDVPSTAKIDDLFPKKGPHATAIALVIKPSQLRKQDTVAKLVDMFKKIVETSKIPFLLTPQRSCSSSL